MTARSGMSSAGLSEAAARVYRELLEQPGHVEEMACRLGSDAGGVRAALSELEGHELVRPSPVDRGLWQAVAPDAAVARMDRAAKAEIANLRDKVQRRREDVLGFVEVYETWNRPRTRVGATEILTGGEIVQDALANLAATATHEVLAVHPTMAPPEVLEAGYGLDQSLLSRGVVYRAVWPHTARRQKEPADYLQKLIADGAQVRTAALPPSRMIMIDRRVAIIPLPERLGAGGAVVRDDVMLHYMLNTFEYTWERAFEVRKADYDTTTLADIESAILQDMARGRTDEYIARRMGISTRTLRRYVTSMGEALGAESRFQLALAAVQSGLLSVDESGQASDSTARPPH